MIKLWFFKIFRIFNVREVGLLILVIIFVLLCFIIFGKLLVFEIIIGIFVVKFFRVIILNGLYKLGNIV